MPEPAERQHGAANRRYDGLRVTKRPAPHCMGNMLASAGQPQPYPSSYLEVHELFERLVGACCVALGSQLTDRAIWVGGACSAAKLEARNSRPMLS